ncbi:MAG: hypothetical protein WBA17_14085 [Saprospiraceae bacterium]
MQPIGLIFNGVWSHYTFAKAEKYRDLYRLIYVHDLDAAVLEGLEALVIPFQSHQPALAERRELLYGFLAAGKKIFVEGDSTTEWLDATWEDRPVNNYWWVENPDNPPVSDTNYEHTIYRGLLPRHACWHTHGAYTRVPEHAEVVQKNAAGEVISWETSAYGGTLFVTTLDPIVEHGIQQITHLDHYVDRLTEWLSGTKPAGKFTFAATDFGVSAETALAN